MEKFRQVSDKFIKILTIWMNEFVALRTFQVNTALVNLQFCIGVEAIHTK